MCDTFSTICRQYSSFSLFPEQFVEPEAGTRSTDCDNQPRFSERAGMSGASYRHVLDVRQARHFLSVNFLAISFSGRHLFVYHAIFKFFWW